MADAWDREQVGKLMVRGLGWCLCVGLWTAALLTTYPVEVGDEVVPTDLQFPAAKCLHVGAYAFLTLYLAWLPLSRRWRFVGLAFLSLHAGGTEFFQQFVPDRHAALTDVLIDHVGLLLGMALTWKRWLPPALPSGGRQPPEFHLPRGADAPRSEYLSSASNPLVSSPFAPAASEDTSTSQCPPRSG